MPIARVETSAGVSTASGGVQQAEAGVAGAEQRDPGGAGATWSRPQAHQREKEATAVQAPPATWNGCAGWSQKDEISQQQFDAAVAASDSARAAADAAKSDVTAAQGNITVAQQRAAAGPRRRVAGARRPGRTRRPRRSSCR